MVDKEPNECKESFVFSFIKFRNLFGLLLTGTVLPIFSSSVYNMPKGVTSVSHDIYQLHMTIFWICVAIGVGVFGVLFYSLIRYRRSRNPKPAVFHEHAWVEVIWTIIPTLILISMAIPATKVLMHMYDSADAEINIKVTGYQWKWRYDYLDEGFGFFSNLSTSYKQIHNEEPKGQWYLLEVDKPLVVPIHKKIRFLVTANDVIHSWWVPELGVKQDGIPGFIQETWARIDKPGVYRGQCAELCGMNHGYMPIVVKAVSEKDYAKWIAQKSGRAISADPAAKAEAKRIQANLNKPMTQKELMQEGEQGYLKHCAVCHQVNGQGIPPAFPSMVSGQISTGPLNTHIDIVLRGKPGTAMQAFNNQLTSRELAAIITYERNAWGNDDIIKRSNYARLVQPKTIEHAKQAK